MPSTYFVVKGNALRTLTSETRRISPGQLVSVSAEIQSGGSEPAHNFIRVLLEGADELSGAYRHLVMQGYIGLASGLSWTGLLPIDDSAQLTAELMSSASATARISFNRID
jgi:hypothetical protein